jgi:hypothetical protein
MLTPPYFPTKPKTMLTSHMYLKNLELVNTCGRLHETGKKSKTRKKCKNGSMTEWGRMRWFVKNIDTSGFNL